MHPTVKALIALAIISAIGIIVFAGLPLVITLKTEHVIQSVSASAGCGVSMFFCIWALWDQWHQPM